MLTNDLRTVQQRMLMVGSCLVAVLDSGAANGISVEEIYERIEDRTIIQYLEHRFDIVKRWALSLFSEEDKLRLLGEWQSLANVVSPEGDMGIANNGIALIIAFVFEGMRMRIDSNNPWPGPEPW